MDVNQRDQTEKARVTRNTLKSGPESITWVWIDLSQAFAFTTKS